MSTLFSGVPASKSLVLGRVVMTSGVSHWLSSSENENLNELRALFVEGCLSRHRKGDWGDSLDPELNDAALASGEDRCLSVYPVPVLYGEVCDNYGRSYDRVWVLTEHDRSVTTVLTPGDY